MRGRVKKNLLAILSAASLMAMMVMPVSAGTTYTPVAGDATSCTFKKYLIMDEGDHVPNVTFNFTVTAGTPIAADTVTKKMEVLAGVGDPKVTAVAFSSADTTKSVADAAEIDALSEIDVKRTASAREDGKTADTGVQLEPGEKFATKGTTVDFSGVTFDEPGIYRYIITETADSAHGAAGIMHDNDVDRVLDVYVEDNGNNTLKVSSYVLHTDAGNVTAGENNGSGDVSPVADKTDGFTNEYSSNDLKIEKEVTGNQASRDKYFALTVKTTGADDNATYTVSIADDNNSATNDGNADAESGRNSATIADNTEKINKQRVTGAELKAGVTFYLQHGQSVVIRGLAPNVRYEVTENAEDYKSAVKTDDTNSGIIGVVADGNKMAVAVFTNTRDGIIPTGIILSVTPWIILGFIVVAGVVFFAIRSKKRYEEE